MSKHSIASSQCLKWLSDNIVFQSNKAAFSRQRPEILLVEGPTDKHFIIDYLGTNVICLISSAYRTFCRAPEIANSKLNIVQLVNSFSRYRAICKVPPRIENVVIWGMIDRDFDGENIPQDPHLLVTDTHDLETLMLSTDDNVMDRVDGCRVPLEDTRKALFMAYQIGCIIRLLRTQRNAKKPDAKKPLKISSGCGDVDYSSIFSTDCRISLPEVIRLEGLESPGSTKFKKTLASLAKDKLIKSKLGPDYCWKIGFKDFDQGLYSDFWDVINGHDAMALLKYLNEDIGIKFKTDSDGANGSRIDRNLEMAVIKAYDRQQFKKTKIYKQMADAELVKCG